MYDGAMRAPLLTAFLLLPGCFDLFPEPCEGRCSGVEPSPNGKWVSCRADGRCLECSEDRDCKTACGANGSCLPCGDETPCQDHLACVRGACLTCAEDAQCGAGEVCVEGQCGAACRDNKDCEDHYGLSFDSIHILDGRGAWFGCTVRMQNKFLCSGQGYYPDLIVCDPCLTAAGGAPCAGCTASGDCPCQVPEDCAPGAGCSGGICGQCRKDADCPDQEVCGEGTCRPPCQVDADCPEGRCARPRGLCAACLQDSDCPGEARCYFDGCVVPCKSDKACFPTRCTENGRCSICDRPPP